MRQIRYLQHQLSHQHRINKQLVMYIWNESLNWFNVKTSLISEKQHLVAQLRQSKQTSDNNMYAVQHWFNKHTQLLNSGNNRQQQMHQWLLYKQSLELQQKTIMEQTDKIKSLNEIIKDRNQEIK